MKNWLTWLDIYKSVYAYNNPVYLVNCLYHSLYPQSQVQGKTVLVTFTICPPIVKLWHYFVKHIAKIDDIEIVVVDSTGSLTRDDFLDPNLHVYPLINASHGWKIDWTIRHLIRSNNVIICDDDIFIKERAGIDWALNKISSNITAVSLRPRQEFQWSVNGYDYQPMGAYFLALQRETFINHNLSFKPVDQYSPNPLSHEGKYDTADFTNVWLLENGHQIDILPLNLQQKTFVELRSMSLPIVEIQKVKGDKNKLIPSHYIAIYQALLAHRSLDRTYKLLPYKSSKKWSIFPIHTSKEDEFFLFMQNKLDRSIVANITSDITRTVDEIYENVKQTV